MEDEKVLKEEYEAEVVDDLSPEGSASEEDSEFEILEKITLDFDKLAEWRQEDKDDIPICSVLSLYKASGITDAIQSYRIAHFDEPVFPIVNLCCNFYTLQRIRNFVTNNWQIYSLDIAADEEVKWDTRKWAKGESHYPKKLKAKIRNSINMDFANFCPGLDDNLEDNILVFRIVKKKKAVKKEPEEEPKSSEKSEKN